MKLRFRRAGLGDSSLLLRWRNDPVVRKYSFTSRIIRSSEHRKWFSAKLRNNGVRVYIVLRGSMSIGQIRFERLDPRISEVHISVASRFRGQGLGSEILKQGILHYRRHIPVRKIVARVRVENVASLKAFRKAGFRAVTRTRFRGVPTMVMHHTVRGKASR